jgi:glycosyltransferase involved in cell wall biosynthesis
MPDLTYVIPAYNSQEWLPFSIGSCIASSHKGIEVIVVNDGSTDHSKRVIDWYASKDERVRAIHLSDNKGSGNARNVGSFEAKSDYIAMLDSDDESTANRATETLKILREKGDSIVYGSCVELDFLGRNMGTLLATPFDLKHSIEKKLAFIVHSSMAYPKSLWEKQPYDTDTYVKLAMEDWKFQMDAAFKDYPFQHTAKVLCGHRLRQGQMAQRDDKKALEVKESYLKEHEKEHEKEKVEA